MGDLVRGPWPIRRVGGAMPRFGGVRTLPLTRECPHETPGGSQRCALCRAEVRRLHGKAAGRRAPEPAWKQQLPARPVPMPDYLRRRLAGHEEPAAVQETLPLGNTPG